MAKRRKGPNKYGAQLLDNPPPQTREKSQAEKEARVYTHWIDEITSAKKIFKPYWERGRKIVKLYKDERKNESEITRANDRMNILWSNVETLKPALYSKDPTPNVSRRFMDGDPVSRTASMILERCLITCQELTDFSYPMMRARDDYLLPGRGTVWVRYAPQFGMVTPKNPVLRLQNGGYADAGTGRFVPPDNVEDDEEIGQYVPGEPEEQVLAHGLDLDHTLWSDFMHEPVNDWTKVGWVSKRIDMKRPRLVKEFGEDKGRRVKLNKSFNGPTQDAESGVMEKGKPDCAEVYEIWSKTHQCVYWITDGLPNEVLKHEEDPLGLHDFWPFPRPLFATTSTDSLIPVPDYALYQDQAEQLDKLTDRIRLLITSLRVVGVYNGALASLQSLLDETGENQMLPVDDWMAFAQNNGLKGNLDWLPIEQIATVLVQLFNARAQIKQDLYEITGMSDVIRGATDPNETATAQQIKSNFANLRLKARQDDMARFARDTLRKMAEIIAEHFPEEALIEMSGVLQMDEFKPSGDQQKDALAQQRLMQAVQLLKQDKLRTFKIDIETDATVAPDQQKEKEARVEFLTAVAPFLEKAAMVGQQAPQLAPLLMKMLDFGVKGFRTGRSLEAAIEETIATAEKMLAESKNNPQPPKDPEAEARAAELQAKTQKVTQELQQAQADAQVKEQENAAKAIENQRRADEQRQLFQKQMLQLTEEIQFRREENALRMKELETQIALANAKIKQMQMQGDNEVLAELQGMIGPNVSPEDQEAALHERRAKIATAQTSLVKAQTEYAELMKRGQGLEGISDALGEIPEADPSKVGTPAFARKKGPMKKMIQMIHDPETGRVMGATVDEIELPHEDEAA